MVAEPGSQQNNTPHNPLNPTSPHPSTPLHTQHHSNLHFPHSNSLTFIHSSHPTFHPSSKSITFSPIFITTTSKSSIPSTITNPPKYNPRYKFSTKIFRLRRALRAAAPRDPPGPASGRRLQRAPPARRSAPGLWPKNFVCHVDPKKLRSEHFWRPSTPRGGPDLLHPTRVPRARPCG